jgi:hypothetical protein
MISESRRAILAVRTTAVTELAPEHANVFARTLSPTMRAPHRNVITFGRWGTGIATHAILQLDLQVFLHLLLGP